MTQHNFSLHLHKVTSQTLPGSIPEWLEGSSLDVALVLWAEPVWVECFGVVPVLWVVVQTGYWYDNFHSFRNSELTVWNGVVLGTLAHSVWEGTQTHTLVDHLIHIWEISYIFMRDFLLALQGSLQFFHQSVLNIWIYCEETGDASDSLRVSEDTITEELNNGLECHVWSH